ncbi:patatin-like phospholipase family protein [Longitalea luteola]|uniref:patatin-like phospholipase family protein n=1 Tax=Longitalea luteola TaxID=2812563 RepID=UPI001A9743CE|nr:patatin-like phospholipase family protein [Longitalea luteola]
MTYNYTNLVFEGGGVKGIAYAGALQVLTDCGIMSRIKQVAGTSAGAITATLIALGYTAPEIKSIIMSMDFSQFEDGWDPLRLPTEYGLYKGNTFLAWIQKMIANKSVKGANASFADLYEQNGIGLFVFATDLNMYDIKQFSHLDTPNVPVCEAVRASMSIPLFFKAWKFSNNLPDNHIYVDGGVVLNYPLTVFDTPQAPDNPQTLGFFLYDRNGNKKPGTIAYDQPIAYCKALFETLLDSQDIDFENDESMEKRTVRIDDFGIAATDFHITQQQKEQLYKSGVYYTEAYLGIAVNA